MDLTAINTIVRAYIHRNKIILSDLNSAAEVRRVNLHWWKLQGDKQNVGDMLSPVVVDFLFRKKNVNVSGPTRRTSHLYAIGSIIDGGYQNATVWGSGLLRDKDGYWWSKLRKLDIRVVRGPLTRQALLRNGYSCPEVYGDPAILMPLFYQPTDSAKKYQYRVVPHMAYGTQYHNVLSPYTDDWRSFIDEIVQSERIISSSLHGVILAEAYGVPAILLNDHDMNLFKYRDYYASTGRTEIPMARTMEEALRMTPPALPDLSALREDLLGSFPSDLWN